MKAGKTSGPDCHFRVTDVIEGTESSFRFGQRMRLELATQVNQQKSWELKIQQVSSAYFTKDIVRVWWDYGCKHFTVLLRSSFTSSWPACYWCWEKAHYHCLETSEKNGGSPIMGYHVEMCPVGTEKWMRVNSRPIKDLKFKVEEGVVPIEGMCWEWELSMLLESVSHLKSLKMWLPKTQTVRTQFLYN